jgi:hypothetical protein
MDRKMDTEIYLVVGQFGTVMSAPISKQSAWDAKAVLDAEKYDPHTVTPVIEAALCLIRASLPRSLLAAYRH